MSNKYAHLSRADDDELQEWKKKRLHSWRRSCGRKRRYPNEILAEKMAAHTTESNKKRGDPRVCRCYYCPFCDGWHVTSKAKGQ